MSPLYDNGMKELVGLIFLSILYNQVLYIQELIQLLDAEHFQVLLCLLCISNKVILVNYWHNILCFNC